MGKEIKPKVIKYFVEKNPDNSNDILYTATFDLANAYQSVGELTKSLDAYRIAKGLAKNYYEGNHLKMKIADNDYWIAKAYFDFEEGEQA